MRRTRSGSRRTDAASADRARVANLVRETEIPIRNGRTVGVDDDRWLHRLPCHGNALRIVGGKLAGRDLTSPADFRVRPTAEHVRAAVLDLLAADLANARVLDLFAGTGALGLEALSRGARSADFVEFRPASLHALRANIAALRVRERTRVFKRDAVQFAAALAAESYDIAFVDPPYDSRQLDLVVASWGASGFARVLVAEHSRAHRLPPGWTQRTFEDTVITIYRR
jgi:16S rRNA (guanine966-N2)-methyltransferase